MRVYELVHEIIQKFAPMDLHTAGQLQNDAATFYGKARDEMATIQAKIAYAKDWNIKFKDEADFKPEPIPKMPLKLVIIEQLESWYCRYLIAILFIILVPKIKSYINGDSSKDEDEDEDDEQSELEQFMEFKRFKKGNR